MQIHELTKTPQRTDEGILDSIKNAVGLSDKAGDKAQEKYWNKNQSEINKSAQQSAAVLSRKGFNVNPHNLPLSTADTPKNIAAGTAGTRSRNDTEFQNKVRYKHLKSLFIKNFVGPNPRPTPESANSNELNEAKDIQRDFPAWIDSQIPGLDKVKQYPTAKSKLDKAFNSLVAAKNDPTALSAAFDNYVQLATNYTDKLQTSNTQQASNSQSNSQIPGSDAFQQGEQLVHNLPQLGITPEISKKVANALRDRTINKDSLIYAIQKAGRGY